MNKVILIGNLGRDPELRTMGDDSSVCNFSLATSYGEKTEWHNCVAWGNQGALIAHYVKKGNKLAVEGRLQTREYEKDGVVRRATEIVVERFDFIEKKNTPPDAIKSDTTAEDRVPF